MNCVSPDVESFYLRLWQKASFNTAMMKRYLGLSEINDDPDHSSQALTLLVKKIYAYYSSRYNVSPFIVGCTTA